MPESDLIEWYVLAREFVVSGSYEIEVASTECVWS